MRTDKSNHYLLWQATCELSEWFGKLGGVNCIFGMYHSEIFGYVACKALDESRYLDFLDETGGTREEVKVIVDEYLNGYELNHNQTNYVQSFVHPKFIEAGGDAVRKADSYIVEITGTHESVKALIIEYIEFYNKKLIASNEASIEWKSLRKTLLATQE